jgi:CBS-domain-containing membrane protein
MPVKKLKRGYRRTRYILYKETLIDYKEHFWAFVGSFTGIGIIAYLQSQVLPASDVIYLIGSFGASGVLVYGVIGSPLAQPRNLIVGHIVSALIGVTVQKFFPDTLYIAAPLSVSLSIVLMQVTKSLHPPGGATALIAVTGSPELKALGYWYVLSPVLIGASILLLTALVFNNMTSNRQYPSSKKFKAIKNRIVHRIRNN